MAEGHRERAREHARTLCRDIGERTLDSGGLAHAETYITTVLAEIGARWHRQTYRYQGHTVANLVCDLGPEGENPLIVGAHYDTVPGTEGADDNASAVAVLLALAEALAAHPPTIPVRLVAFTLEEPPAFQTRWQGSRVFTRRMRAAGESTRGALILEMVGYTAAEQHYPAVLRWAGYPATGDFIGLVGDGRSRPLVRRLARAFATNPELPVATLCVPLRGWPLPATRLSDHSSFWDNGWPAVMITDTAFFRNPHYHRPSDRLETLDAAFMGQLVTSLELAVAALAR